MITVWDIYWITRLDAISGLFIVISIAVLMSIFTLCMLGDCHRDNIFYYKKSLIASIIIVTFFSLAATFIPSTKDYAAIYLIPKIAKNEQIQKIPDNAIKLLNGKMEEWIADIGKKNK
jgi:magnesium-transporting ATPase (P-type)